MGIYDHDSPYKSMEKVTQRSLSDPAVTSMSVEPDLNRTPNFRCGCRLYPLITKVFRTLYNRNSLELRLQLVDGVNTPHVISITNTSFAACQLFLSQNGPHLWSRTVHEYLSKLLGKVCSMLFAICLTRAGRNRPWLVHEFIKQQDLYTRETTGLSRG